jgi:hypothetical protein
MEDQEIKNTIREALPSLHFAWIAGKLINLVFNFRKVPHYVI